MSETKMRKKELEYEVKSSTPEGIYVTAFKSMLTFTLLLPQDEP